MKRAYNRRKFLKQMASGAGACCASTLFNKLSFTVCPVAHAATNGKIIVALYLNGGPDWLDWLRPDIAELNGRRDALNDILATGLPVNGHGNLLWNPRLTTFKAENDAGNMAAINFVGPENHSGSHEVARTNWNYGKSNGTALAEPGNGWFARTLNALGAESNFACFNLASLSLSQGTTAVTNGSLGSFGWSQTNTAAQKARNTLFSLASQQGGAGSQAEDLLRSYSNAEASVERVRDAIQSTNFNFDYPETPTGRALRDAERVIRNFDETCAIAIQRGGHDTHSNQRNGNNASMSDINDAISVFYANMRSRGLGDKVTLLVYGEFGRQITENSNAGTDHGRAGSVFVFGDAVNGGIYGPDYTAATFHPGTNRLNVEVNTVDVLGPIAQWLGANPNDIFENYNAGSAIPIL